MAAQRRPSESLCPTLTHTQPSHFTPTPTCVAHSQVQLQVFRPITSQVSMHTTSAEEPFLWHCPIKHSEPSGSGSAFGQVSVTPLAAVKDTIHLQHHFRLLLPPPLLTAHPLHPLLLHLLHTLCYPTPFTPHLPLPSTPCCSTPSTPCCPTPSMPLKQIRMLAQCVCLAAQAVRTLADSAVRRRHAPTAAHVVAVTAGCPWQQLAGICITASVGPGTDAKARVALFPLPQQAVSTELLCCF